jgi:small redox-active disulfide protein 2
MRASRDDKEKTMKTIQILGTGCPKCKKLAENAEAAAKALGLEYTLEKITDITAIMKFGVMMTPALAVDGVVKVVGKVPEPEAIKALLS